jgi:hypothetical protein
LRLAWILDILKIGIAGAGLGGLVHFRYRSSWDKFNPVSGPNIIRWACA